MIGATLLQRKIIKNKSRNIPHFSRKFSIYLYFAGIKLNKTLDPSRGGIGMRLNRARTKFKITIIDVILRNEFDSGIPVNSGANLINKPKNITSTRFARIPAIATKKVPFLSLRRFFGLYGTGLAQPITKPAFIIIKRSGSITDPKGSRCFNGFKVSRPLNLAVLSPRRYAVYP